jgi:hypothetical protein
LLGFELGFIEGSDDGCNNGCKYGVEDGFIDGLPLGFELGFVRSSDNGLKPSSMMALKTVSGTASMILHNMVEKIKRLEIELDCILKVVSSRMPHTRATTRVGTTRSNPNLYHHQHCQGRHEAHVL